MLYMYLSLYSLIVSPLYSIGPYWLLTLLMYRGSLLLLLVSCESSLLRLSMGVYERGPIQAFTGRVYIGPLWGAYMGLYMGLSVRKPI